MAKKERKFVNVNGSEPTSAPKTEVNKGKATGQRIGAVVIWLLAIACEVLAICMINGILYIPDDKMTMWLIIALVADLVFVIIGSLLWKSANDIDPASSKNKTKFFLWNNMGVIVSLIAFFPFIIILLNNKKLDGKLKKTATAIAAAAMLIAGAVSYDWNPKSAEDLAAAKEEVVAENGTDVVYWTQWGKSYHLNPDCQTLQNSATVYQGTIEQAYEAHRTDPCDFCADGK